MFTSNNTSVLLYKDQTPEHSQTVSPQFQKSNTSLLYTSQNWDLEDELYQEDSFTKLYKSVEKDKALQSASIYIMFK